jgi:hypothetical protein
VGSVRDVELRGQGALQGGRRERLVHRAGPQPLGGSGGRAVRGSAPAEIVRSSRSLARSSSRTQMARPSATDIASCTWQLRSLV